MAKRERKGLIFAPPGVLSEADRKRIETQAGVVVIECSDPSAIVRFHTAPAVGGDAVFYAMAEAIEGAVYDDVREKFAEKLMRRLRATEATDATD